jgi:REP element-mobilizing transposase RayT
MFLQLYQPHELHFAYCYRVYLRWRTYRGLPCAPLARLDRAVLEGLVHEYHIRVLECATNATDLLSIVSLRPAETISACAGKLKGQVSKWLREALRWEQPTRLLSKGYFACTVGKSTGEAVEQYLSRQGEHHGYGQRRLPPVFVDKYELTAADKARISAKHAMVGARFHLVLATFGRRGLLGSQEGRKVASEWRRLQNELRIALVKVSFVPDHVHLALRVHPTVSPSTITAALMNVAQEVMQHELSCAGLERLWEPSAYLGSYGDLASPQIHKYIEHWSGSKQTA